MMAKASKARRARKATEYEIKSDLAFDEARGAVFDQTVFTEDQIKALMHMVDALQEAAHYAKLSAQAR